MLELIAQNMAPIMFASLVVFLLLGYPVAFSLAANGLFFFAIGVWLTPYSGGAFNLDWPLLDALNQRMGGVMSNETLLAIPFFTFMGVVLERSGMAEDLLDTIGQLFGPIRGGLAYAVIIVGALLAATTGVVAASVIAMGLISLPIMMRYGYDRRVASGVIAASGTLAQIIPPSLVLILLADQLGGLPVGDMYKGAIIPGLVLTGLYMGYVFLLSIIRPSWVPALPKEARTLGHGLTSLVVVVALIVLFFLLPEITTAITGWIGPDAALSPIGTWLTWANDQVALLFGTGPNAEMLRLTVAVVVAYGYALADQTLRINLLSHLTRRVIIVLIPPLALIFLVLGTIFLGIATPTEGGAMGAVGAMVLAAMKGRLSYTVISQALASTTRLSAFVMFILIGARVFSLAFYGVNGQIWVEHLLVALPGGQTGFLIIVSIIVFLLAFFLDFFELAFIIVPLLIAPAVALDIDLIWFGVILAVNMQTSFMHPPFGFALFYLRSVAPRGPYNDKVTGERLAGVSTGQIYWGAVPFVVIQVVMIGIVIAFPQMVMHYKGKVVDPNSVKIEIPALNTLPQPGGAPAGATLGAPVINP
jgi:tripartite ATP-independent transporter DctM subunit